MTSSAARKGEPSPPAGEARHSRWKRTALLVPFLIGVVAVAETGPAAVSKVSQAGGIVAALKDPLALFAQRSPGERGIGPLLQTKPGKAAPEERVLSTERERPPPLGIPPILNDPAFSLDPRDLAASNALPEDPIVASSFFAPPPGGFFDPDLVPGHGLTGVPPVDPGIPSAVPEPATWAMLILGFFGIGMAARRRGRSRLSGAR